MKYINTFKKNKYNAVKTNVDGDIYDSKLEAQRWEQLRLLSISGVITELERQVSYIIAPPVEWGAMTYRARVYRADFRYREGGRTIVEDVKGHLTDLYRLKRHLFLVKYGHEVEFKEIRKGDM